MILGTLECNVQENLTMWTSIAANKFIEGFVTKHSLVFMATSLDFNSYSYYIFKTCNL